MTEEEETHKRVEAAVNTMIHGLESRGVKVSYWVEEPIRRYCERVEGIIVNMNALIELLAAFT